MLLENITHQKFTLKDMITIRILIRYILYTEIYFYRTISIILNQHATDRKYHYSIKCNPQQCEISTIMNQMFETETETLMETQTGSLRMNL